MLEVVRLAAAASELEGVDCRTGTAGERVTAPVPVLLDVLRIPPACLDPTGIGFCGPGSAEVSSTRLLLSATLSWAVLAWSAVATTSEPASGSG